MATMTINLVVTITDGAFQTDSFNPPATATTISGLHMRRVLTLAANTFTTLDTGDLTPRYWYLHNLHDTGSLVVSFGVSDDITLAPGEWAWVPSTLVPMAKGSGAASRLLYGIVEA